MSVVAIVLYSTSYRMWMYSGGCFTPLIILADMLDSAESEKNMHFIAKKHITWFILDYKVLVMKI